MRLSVIMPSLECRVSMRDTILSQINDSGKGIPDWELLVAIDDGSRYSIGAKMNLLLEQAQGEYIVGVADDDEVSADYIPAILEGLESNPDVLTFDHEWRPDMGHKIGIWEGHCTQLHPLNAVHRRVYEGFQYPDRWEGEDRAFRRLLEGLDREGKIEVKHQCRPVYRIYYRHEKPEFNGRHANAHGRACA